MPLCASLRPLVESAPAASHSSISQFASSSSLCLLPRLGGPLSISSSLCAQRAADRLPQTREWRDRAFRSCGRMVAHGTRARRGSTPPCALMWRLGGLGSSEGRCVEQQQQQQQQQQQHASSSSSSSSSSSRRARGPQLRARGVRVLPGACARAWADRHRSPAQQPQRMPLDSRPKQRSLVLDPARFGQRARRAVRPVCSPAVCDAARRAAMTAYNCFRCGVPGG